MTLKCISVAATRLVRSSRRIGDPIVGLPFVIVFADYYALVGSRLQKCISRSYRNLGLIVELHKREIHGIGGDTVDSGVCLAKTFALLVETLILTFTSGRLS
jgi:hypothetical protein